MSALDDKVKALDVMVKKLENTVATLHSSINELKAQQQSQYACLLSVVDAINNQQPASTTRSRSCMAFNRDGSLSLQ